MHAALDDVILSMAKIYKFLHVHRKLAIVKEKKKLYQNLNYYLIICFPVDEI